MKNPIAECMNEQLIRVGFVRSGNTWRKDQPEVILVVNLQSSMYGKQYYINLGIYVKSIGGGEKPGGASIKEVDCHIRNRAAPLGKYSSEYYNYTVLNLENTEIRDSRRLEDVRHLIIDASLPFLEGCSSKDGIVKALRKGKLESCFVRKDVYSLLG